MIPAIEQALSRLDDTGVQPPSAVVILPGAGEQWIAEPMANSYRCALAVTVSPHHLSESVVLAVIRGTVAAERWNSVLRSAADASGWSVLRALEFGEWCDVVAAGIDATRRAFPEWPMHRLLGINRGALRSLRLREKHWRQELASARREGGRAAVIRWFEPHSLHRGDPPPRCGAYLTLREGERENGKGKT